MIGEVEVILLVIEELNLLIEVSNRYIDRMIQAAQYLQLIIPIIQFKPPIPVIEMFTITLIE